MAKEWFYDCHGCGEIGRSAELRQHPTRPIPEDLGFCPHCGCEVYEYLNREEISEVLRSYDEDPDDFLAALPL